MADLGPPTIEIGLDESTGSGRIFKVRPQTFGLRRDIADLIDRQFGVEMEQSERAAQLNHVAGKLEALGQSTNGFDVATAEKLRDEANGIGRQMRELDDARLECRMRIIARRLDPVDEEWVLNKLDERRLPELEAQLAGRPLSLTPSDA